MSLFKSPISSEQTSVLSVIAPIDLAAQNNFGWAVSLSGDAKTLLVGASKDVLGKAFIYEKVNGVWVLSKEFADVSSGYGFYVALNAMGDYAAVSAPAKIADGDGGKGAVLIYHRTASGWEPFCVIRSDVDAQSEFGFDMSLDAAGQFLVVGNYGGLKSHMYERQGSTFNRVHTFEKAGNQYGRKVALSPNGRSLAISDNNISGSDLSGKVYIYTRTSDSWVDAVVTEIAPDLPVSGQRFGWSMALNSLGTVLAAGCYAASVGEAKKAGRVYVFRLIGQQWRQIGLIEQDNPAENNSFGLALALNSAGDELVIGAFGDDSSANNSGRAFRISIKADHVGRLAVIDAPSLNINAQFGYSVDISGDGTTWCIGAPGANHSGNPTGAVFTFTDSSTDNSGGTVYNIPGVYLEESNIPLLSVSQGSSAVPVFIGHFRALDGAPALDDACIPIASFFEFQQYFGESATLIVTDGAMPTFELDVALGSRAVRHYFDNGGSACYILPINDPSNSEELAALLDKIRRVPQINLFCTTEITTGLDPIYDALSPLLTEMGAGFLIADSPDGVIRPATTAQRTAVYYPALETLYSPRPEDRFIEVRGLESPTVPWFARLTLDQVKRYDLPAYKRLSKAIDAKLAADYPAVYLKASAAIAGQYCRTDSQQGVWKAPAGTTLNNVRALHPSLGARVERQLLTNRINALKAIPGEGVKIWGARTTVDPATPLWLHIPVSRLFDAAARDIQRAMRLAVFKPNNAMTWATVRASIENYLHKLWRDGGLKGATPEQAFYVQIGQGLSMTDEQIADGQLIVNVGMAALRPVEFIEVVFSQLLDTGLGA